MRTIDLATCFSQNLRFPAHFATSKSQRMPQPRSFRNANFTIDSYILLATFYNNEAHILHVVIR